MHTYPLETLAQVREHDKNRALMHLNEARNKCIKEKKALKHLKNKITQKKYDRFNLANDFFEKAKARPFSKSDLACLSSLTKKILKKENELSKSLSKQYERVKLAKGEEKKACAALINAHRRLGIIDKHKQNWQQKKKRSEDLKNEYINDDLNGTRYFLSCSKNG